MICGLVAVKTGNSRVEIRPLAQGAGTAGERERDLFAVDYLTVDDGTLVAADGTVAEPWAAFAGYVFVAACFVCY